MEYTEAAYEKWKSSIKNKESRQHVEEAEKSGVSKEQIYAYGAEADELELATYIWAFKAQNPSWAGFFYEIFKDKQCFIDGPKRTDIENIKSALKTGITPQEIKIQIRQGYNNFFSQAYDFYAPTERDYEEKHIKEKKEYEEYIKGLSEPFKKFVKPLNDFGLSIAEKIEILDPSHSEFYIKNMIFAINEKLPNAWMQFLKKYLSNKIISNDTTKKIVECYSKGIDLSDLQQLFDNSEEVRDSDIQALITKNTESIEEKSEIVKSDVDYDRLEKIIVKAISQIEKPEMVNILGIEEKLEKLINILAGSPVAKINEYELSEDKKRWFGKDKESAERQEAKIKLIMYLSKSGHGKRVVSAVTQALEQDTDPEFILYILSSVDDDEKAIELLNTTKCVKFSANKK